MRMANRCLSYTLGKTKVPFYQPIIIYATLVPNKKKFICWFMSRGDVHIPYKYIIICVICYTCHGLKFTFKKIVKYLTIYFPIL